MKTTAFLLKIVLLVSIVCSFSGPMVAGKKKALKKQPIASAPACSSSSANALSCVTDDAKAIALKNNIVNILKRDDIQAAIKAAAIQAAIVVGCNLVEQALLSVAPDNALVPYTQSLMANTTGTSVDNTVSTIPLAFVSTTIVSVLQRQLSALKPTDIGHNIAHAFTYNFLASATNPFSSQGILSAIKGGLASFAMGRAIGAVKQIAPAKI